MTEMTTTPTRAARDGATRDLPVAPSAGRLRPLGMSEVQITGGFWAERQRVNAEATLDHCDRWEQKVGWIDNFARVAEGTVPEHRTGREFADSDVYKLVEAMAWEVGRSGDARLDARIEELAELIGRAQEPDGYLNTRYGHPGMPARYSDLAWGHELYCYGHLIQAAVARLRTGHDDRLVAIARRAADHVCETFGPDGIAAVCGHPEIEVALAELSRVTGEPRYLRQAELFLARRGTGTLPEIEFGRAYYQDDVPVREATVLRGHAVRALYLTAAVVDVAVETADLDLLAAAERQYAATLARRTYLTGGMGSHHQDEAFGDDHELPPDRAYCETCAGVGSVMVAWRLLLATGRAEYADVIERTLYNAIAASPAADGRSFFYTNPLQVRRPGAETDPDELSPRAFAQMRAPWFEVSCCPTNVARTFAQLACYVATVDAHGVQLHQYASSRITTQLGDGRPVGLEVRTGYPVDGDVEVTVTEAPGGEWALSLRVPGWASGAMTVDGVPVTGPVAVVPRTLVAGDVVRVHLPVEPRLTAPDGRIDAVRGCVAVERGPVVLCAESVDLPAGLQVDDVRVDLAAPVRDAGDGAVLRGTVVRHTERSWPYPTLAGTAGRSAAQDALPEPVGEPFDVPLVPYHAWAERGPSTMRVWLPTT